MLKKIAAAIRSMIAAMGKLVVIPVRLADGVLTYVVQLIRPSPVSMPTEEVDDDPSVAANDNTDNVTTRYETVGAMARKAAAEMAEHGVVLSKDIPLKIRNWIVSIGRDDWAALLAADDDMVGRHIAGVATIVVEGFGPVRRPDAERDERTAKEHAARVELKARSLRPTRPIPVMSPDVKRVVGLRP